jgi:hypothetical protein
MWMPHPIVRVKRDAMAGTSGDYGLHSLLKLNQIFVLDFGEGPDGGKSLNGSARLAVHQCASSSQDSRMRTELDVSKSTAAASADGS